MKRVYVHEEWCLGCHLCEYNCAFAASGQKDIARALMNTEIRPRIRVEENDKIHFAVSCRHCDDPVCVKSCIAGAISKEDGVIKINKEKCVHCYTCVMSCPYGTISVGPDGAAQKCQLCTANGNVPACVDGCPNRAIVFEEA